MNYVINVQKLIDAYNFHNQELYNRNVCYMGELYTPPNGCASYYRYDNVNHVNHAPMYPKRDVYDCAYVPNNDYFIPTKPIYCGAIYLPFFPLEDKQLKTNGFQGFVEETLKGTCMNIKPPDK